MISRILNENCTEKSEKGHLEVIPNNHTIRDNRFSDPCVTKIYKPVFLQKNFESKSYDSWSDDIENKIADSFEKKDVIELVEMLCNCDKSPLYIRKTSASPLYVHMGGSLEELNETIREKIELVETAVFLLLNDEAVDIKEIAGAYNIFSQKNSIYKPPLKLIDEFHKKLGLFENTRKVNSIINQLKEARKNLEFNR